MATNTEQNVGIRQNFPTFGYRNFETSGIVEYVARRDNLFFNGTSYDYGQTLPFDVGGVSYSASAMAQLQLYWNNLLIKPLV